MTSSNFADSPVPPSHRFACRGWLALCVAGLVLLLCGTASAQAPGQGGDSPSGDGGLPFPFRNKVSPPALTGGLGWLNTAGPLELDDLKGKFVLLDFWTYCCINCMHILPELKKLEHAYPNNLVVIGVHSAKFEGEQDTQNIRDAILRYEIEHPVINDGNMAIWNRYGIRSWPSLILIDPEGNAVFLHSGEFQFESFDQLLQNALPYYRERGLLDETPLRFDLEAYQAQQTPLRYPGKILADEAGGRLFVADSTHNRLVVTGLDGKLLSVIGSGQVGSQDGDFATAQFNKPQGMCLVGDALFVADTENHLIRVVDLKSQRVQTVAGTGTQTRYPWPGADRDAGPQVPGQFTGDPRTTDIASPWDLWEHDGSLFIAMAGPHQIWQLSLNGGGIGLFAGNGREDIVDGPLLPPQPFEEGFASFAQPSGLASDGTWLYVADSEGSSIRAVPLSGTGDVRTIVGTAHLRRNRLFTFGDVDGPGRKARLQHVLGIVFYRDQLYVADTYNNKIKVINPESHECTTLAGTGQPGSEDGPALGGATFDEPAGITAANGKLYVADTNSHKIRVIDLDNGNVVSTLEITGLEPPPREEVPIADSRPVETIEVAEQSAATVDGQLRLAVSLTLPAGWKINPLAPMRYSATATGAAAAGAVQTSERLSEPSAQFVAAIPLPAQGDALVTLSLDYFYCQDGDEGLCKAGRIAWKVPVIIAADGTTEPVALEYVVP